MPCRQGMYKLQNFQIRRAWYITGFEHSQAQQKFVKKSRLESNNNSSN